MAEPARKIDYEDENNGIMKDREADDYGRESFNSNLLRQAQAKARKDLDPKNKIINLDDYRANRNQARQNFGKQKSFPALDLNERLKQNQEKGTEDQEAENKNPFQGGEGLDTRLMQQQGREKEGEDKKEDEGEQSKEGADDQESQDAAQMNADKRKKKESLRDKARRKGAEKATKIGGKAMGKLTGKNLAGQGPKKMLRWAWVNSLETLGLSIIIYVNIHVFCRWVFGEEFFCKLGDEWDELEGGSDIMSGEQSEGKQNVKKKWAGLGELLILIILDAIVLIVIGIFLTFIVMIIQFMEASLWEKVKVIWSVLKGGSDVVWAGVSALYDLFAK